MMHLVLTIIALVALLALVFGYLAVTCFFTQVTYLTAYRAEFQHSGSRREAVKAGFRVFVGRPPFDVLETKDLERLSQIFSLVPDPMVVAQIVRMIDRRRDASQLKDERYLSKLEERYREMAEHHSD